jgi:hypothetical protein
VTRRSGIGALSLCLAALGTLPSGLGAQSLVSGVVTGTVRSTEGTPMRDARVTLTDVRSGVIRAAATRPDGGFELLFVAPGDYEVRVEQLGWRPHLVRGLAVWPERTVHLDVVLQQGQPPFLTVDTTTSPRAAGRGRATR